MFRSKKFKQIVTLLIAVILIAAMVLTLFLSAAA